MPAIPPRSPVERFALIIDLLCRATAARSAGGRLAGPLIVLIWTRLRRLGTRFCRRAARIAAGAKPPPARRRAAPRKTPARPYPRLPRGFAWLVRLVPQAAAGGTQLQHLLTDPEMAALLAADPLIGRALRPLCRMLGVPPPPGLTPPDRAPPARAVPPTAPPPAAVRPGGAAPPAAAPGNRRAAFAPPVRPTACGPPVPA